jgi:hypothetical protein
MFTSDEIFKKCSQSGCIADVEVLGKEAHGTDTPK